MMRDLVVGIWLLLGTAVAWSFEIAFPTYNRGLVEGNLAGFYMPTDLKNRPPSSGAWGFVRNLRHFPEGKIYTRFHEGLDIRPLKRDGRGLPLDIVKAIAPGRVVYVNPVANRSSYGIYVVVQHNWGDGPFYSLYAHLASASTQVGKKVKAGSPLGRLGSTGRGLNNARAHLHLELNILLTERFDAWHKHFLGEANVHGNHNGINLAGLDLASVYTKSHKDRGFSLRKFLYHQPQYFRITTPRRGGGTLPLTKRYPWLRFGKHDKASPSWEIAFTRSGFLVGIAPSQRVVTEPTVTYVRSNRIDHRYYTRGRLSGTGSKASLTKSGRRYIAMITDEFP